MKLSRFNALKKDMILIAIFSNRDLSRGPLITKKKCYRVLSASPKSYHNIISFETDGQICEWNTFKKQNISDLGKYFKIERR